jgi:hypothetical protein
VQWEVQYNFALMQQLSAAVTSAALMTDSVFPYVTLPQFEVTAGYVDGMGGIMAAAFAPLIKGEERIGWEEYAVQNQGWLTESARLKTVHPGHRDALHGTIQDHEHDRRLVQSEEPPAPSSTSIPTQIYRWKNGTQVPETSLPGQVLAPLWQVSPASAPAVNSTYGLLRLRTTPYKESLATSTFLTDIHSYSFSANLLSDKGISDLYDAMIATNQSVLSTATEIYDVFDYLFDPEEKPNKKHPHGFLMEPVYSAFEENPDLVGILIGLTSFGNLLDRLLPKGANGIVCVIKDTCGHDITYELNGPLSTYLGAGDLHDPQFNKHARVTRMEMYKTIVDGLCVHDLYIYPSSTFRNSYNTNSPAIYTSLVVLAFVVTSILLIIYDRYVLYRRRLSFGHSTLHRARLTELSCPYLYSTDLQVGHSATR